ncbi:CvpA family protein [Kordiimonas lipolytica]|uniref:CvpA family protein n=1 Tax=Kordiimonas lipolytica TaxID=1662421 RepID=A0ABV8U930_9PROT|nr:CvpA family protein [Kordiimonas lipolytica]
MDIDTTTLTAFDVAVLVIVGLSTLLAFGRGFATVALSFGAWAGALLATIFGLEIVKPYGRDLISPPELADFITLATLFFITLFVLKQLAEFIGRTIKESPVGLLDRSLGALFGLLRGLVIVSVLYLGFAKLYGTSDQPDWVKNAQLRPLVAWSAEMLEGFAADALGKDPKEVGNEYLEKAADAIPSQFINEKLEEQAAKYIEKQRDSLDALMEDVAEEKKKKDDGGR